MRISVCCYVCDLFLHMRFYVAQYFSYTHSTTAVSIKMHKATDWANTNRLNCTRDRGSCSHVTLPIHTCTSFCRRRAPTWSTCVRQGLWRQRQLFNTHFIQQLESIVCLRCCQGAKCAISCNFHIADVFFFQSMDLWLPTLFMQNINAHKAELLTVKFTDPLWKSHSFHLHIWFDHIDK